MINKNILDIISGSIGFVYIIPIVLYFITYDTFHLKALYGLIGTVITSEGLKKYIIKDISPRPKDAINCNLLCNDGNQGGRPGMPSSHTATIVFFTSMYFNKIHNIYVRIILIIYTALMMLSRYLKRCHTINQIGGGLLLGFILSQLVLSY
jgi:membrane-associated phospholipid phosphatase